MILQLTNDTKSYSFEVNDLNYGEKLYYNFQIPTAEMEDGKYNMVLIDDNDVVVAEDVVCIGDFNSETIQYKRAENVYINTTLDANIEDVKEETIDNFETTIYPNDGYDAMKAVVVNAQPVYDNGYNDGENVGYNSGYTAGDIDGYNRGYNEGETDQKAKLTNITITNNGTYTSEDGYGEVVVDVPDLNGDYNEGYDAGKIDGYDSGYTAGETEQKSKLTNITISENGTYTREDGYNTVVVNVEDTNGSYDEGYQAGIEEGTANAGEIIAQTARVLNITENGTYTSEYSQWDDYSKPELVTGVFEDGKEFYNEAYPQGIVYKTNSFTITPQTKVELWFKPVNYGWTTNYFSLDVREVSNEFLLKVNGGSSTKNSFEAKIGNCSVYIDLTELEYKKMHHIVMSFVDGFWLDGVKVGDFEGDFTINNSSYGFKINPSAINVGGSANYGMFKIDDVVIIPTEDGFLNVNTNELLTYTNASTQSHYTYYNNFTEPVAEGNLIRTINVDVIPKIDVAKYGIKLSQSTFTEIPEMFDFSNVTDMSNMFYSCPSLQTIPLMNTSNVTNMNAIFQYCNSLQTIPLLNTSNVTNMTNMFAGCKSLQTIPQLDTRNVTNMNSMFQSCVKLINIPPLNAENLNMTTTYQGLFMYDELPNLTDFGGLIGLKYSLNSIYTFLKLPNLTYQSCINILNGLYDFTGNGETPTSSQGQIKVHPNFLTTVGDEISIGTDKGWIITA